MVREITATRLTQALERISTAKETAQKEATRLREAGWTWRQIGAAAGITGQMAQKRWDPAQKKEGATTRW